MTRDAKVEHRLRPIPSHRAVFKKMLEGVLLRSPTAIDTTEDAEGGQQSLDTTKEFLRCRGETDVSTLLTIDHATVCVEKALEERCDGVGRRLLH